MRPLIRSRVTRAATAALLAGATGLAKLVLLWLSSRIGQQFGTLNDLALAVMVLAIAPIMLGSYELGGVTPLWPARLSLAAGIAATVVYGTLQLALVAGLVAFDYTTGATGLLLIQSLALVAIGLWLIGAPLLAGPWLPGLLRLLGALSGLGATMIGIGLIVGGINHEVTYAGGAGFDLLFPVWALLMSAVFRSRASSLSTAGIPPAG